MLHATGLEQGAAEHGAFAPLGFDGQQAVIFGDALDVARGLDLAAAGAPFSDKISRDHAAFSKVSLSPPVERMKRLAQWEWVGWSLPEELRRLVELPGPD